jgi:hypothetical protein
MISSFQESGREMRGGVCLFRAGQGCLQVDNAVAAAP